MSLELQKVVAALLELGRHFDVSENNHESLFASANYENPWFTPGECQRAFRAWHTALQEPKISEWIQKEGLLRCAERPLSVALIMAGNIPLVGLHDLLSVILAGHKAMIKLSSDDSVLMKFAVRTLLEAYPQLADYITISDAQLKNFNAAIATGSNNSARYFEYYFKNCPNIIRRNRNSIAILDKDTTEAEMQALGDDVFSYFGKGCRNVTLVLLPENIRIENVLDQWQDRYEIINNNKYANNYTYHRAILLLNRAEHLDNGFLLLQNSDKVYAPVSILHYNYYKSCEELARFVEEHSEHIQCIAGKDYIPFGKTQQPELWDYADGVNTMQFLMNL